MTASADSGVQTKREGRLADPDRDLRSDPRTDPRLLAALAAFGLDAPAAPPPFGRSAGQAAIAEFVGGADAAFEGLYAALPNDLPGDDKQAVTHATETLSGPTGDNIVLHIARPVGIGDPLPCTVYVHGGGMTVLSTDNKVHRQWRTDLAAAGMVAIGLDFRNAWTQGALNPFPAGLDDCATAVAWLSQNRARLGISKVVLQGESGGANLVLATALMLIRFAPPHLGAQPPPRRPATRQLQRGADRDENPAGGRRIASEGLVAAHIGGCAALRLRAHRTSTGVPGTGRSQRSETDKHDRA
jgi:hypothetical protein